jgi:hypothetical protein
MAAQAVIARQAALTPELNLIWQAVLRQHPRADRVLTLDVNLVNALTAAQVVAVVNVYS